MIAMIRAEDRDRRDIAPLRVHRGPSRSRDRRFRPARYRTRDSGATPRGPRRRRASPDPPRDSGAAGTASGGDRRRGWTGGDWPQELARPAEPREDVVDVVRVQPGDDQEQRLARFVRRRASARIRRRAGQVSGRESSSRATRTRSRRECRRGAICRSRPFRIRRRRRSARASAASDREPATSLPEGFRPPRCRPLLRLRCFP